MGFSVGSRRRAPIRKLTRRRRLLAVDVPSSDRTGSAPTQCRSGAAATSTIQADHSQTPQDKAPRWSSNGPTLAAIPRQEPVSAPGSSRQTPEKIIRFVPAREPSHGNLRGPTLGWFPPPACFQSRFAELVCQGCASKTRCGNSPRLRLHLDHTIGIPALERSEIGQRSIRRHSWVVSVRRNHRVLLTLK